MPYHPEPELTTMQRFTATIGAVVIGSMIGAFCATPVVLLAQQTTNPATATATGLVSIDLGDDLASTGAGTAVAVPWLDTARLQVIFSSADGANDVDIEGSVDGGTTYHLLEDVDGNAATLTADGIVTVVGPLTHIRANVQGLGTEITVDINGRGTVR